MKKQNLVILTRIGVIDLLLLGVVGLLIDADFLVATDPDLSSGNRCGDTDLLSDYITHTQPYIKNKIIIQRKQNRAIAVSTLLFLWNSGRKRKGC